MHKILILAPFEKIEAILIYPFLLKVRELYPESEINLLCKEGQRVYFSFLDLKIKTYEVPLADYKLAFMHKYAVNLHDVFNINLYIDLSGEFLGAMIGVFFRAETKFGYHRDLKSKLMFSKSVEFKDTDSFEKRINSMLSLFEQENLEIYKTARTEFKRKNSPLKFFFFYEDLLKEKESLLWIDLVNQIYEQEIIFWLDEKDREEFTSNLNNKSEYFFHMGELSALQRYFSEVDVVLTDQQWVLFLCEFLGTSCFYFKRNDIAFEQSGSFTGPFPVITFEEESILDIIDGGEKKPIKVVDEVLDFIHDKLKI
ncbi:hypothetical protein HBN50_04855 [Halobacteriovorax sp. GB3]|uniref:hypothetical protein n=1 Tax=Halobacteriovorax sp. GB3 TaxID=2719615 RepID=UPI00236050BF|nr:hypothetical protein [Halobacteriovorax sp. GB3]MDD0852413.1 hypothetical protein [Halobacteriovorax sp. GB3]